MSKNKNWSKIAFYSVICLVVIGVCSYIVYSQAPVLFPSETVAKSTFVATSYVDGEDVSDVLPLSLWTPKSTAEFDTTEDIYAIALNFQESTANVRADDISLDLSSYAYVWVESDPTDTTPFATTWRLILPSGNNGVYRISAYDPTTDVNFNMVDLNMNEVTVATHQTDGNFTLVYDCPHYTTTASQMHYGTYWDCTATEFDDLTTTQKEWYYNEMNFAGQFPLFNPADFVYKTTLSHPLLSSMTNGFCFQFTFNTTISIVDGNSAQVNFTLSDNSPFETVISGANIYLIAYQPILFTSGIQQLHFEMSYAVNISLSDIDSGNVPVLQSGNALGTFVKLSDIAA